ncbi:MAG: glycosyltransferase family 2 protein [Prevotella sp.]|nr:glycosyltransferase family 2 protein [Prevotella sp.]
MNHSLSVLIPVFNCSCRDLVTALHEQLCKEAIQWEIIVADDGSEDEQMKAENRAICSLDNVRLIEREVNSGRAKIRNFLASEAQYDRLLFLDGDNSLRNDKFISNYLAHETSVVYGGYDIIHDDSSLLSNLRYRYELKAEGNHSVIIRQQKPYQNFNTKNFLVNKEVMTRFPFDERFRHYGYEDVLWGKTLCDNSIAIKHINNPVTATDFETNEHFVRKTEEGLRTLHQFSDELQGFSPLLDYDRKIRQLHLAPLFHLIYKFVHKSLLHNLEGNNPSVFKFNIYKLLYFEELRNKRS